MNSVTMVVRMGAMDHIRTAIPTTAVTMAAGDIAIDSCTLRRFQTSLVDMMLFCAQARHTSDQNSPE